MSEITIAKQLTVAIGAAIVLALAGLELTVYLPSARHTERTGVAEGKESSMASNSESGIVALRSNHSVDQTVEKIEKTLQAKGVKIFALVDHNGEAEGAGLSMPPTKLLIFGNPKAGTPLMLASPSAAIDLPLKILVSEDSKGQVWISYNSPSYLQVRHNLPQSLLQNIAVVEAIAASAAE
jgi:uncharacterized protein (DUF302 family)